MSEIKSDQELPNDFIIRSEYYDRYRLVFSYYHLDRKLVRIGRNGKQKEKGRTITRRDRGFEELNDSWNGMEIFSEGNSIQEFPTVSSKISQGQHIVN